MKTALFIIVTLMLVTTASGEKNKTTFRYDIDTLELRHDTLLAKITGYKNGDLDNVITAFLFPDSIKVPRFRLFHRWAIFGNLLTKTLYCKRITRHGESIEYISNGRKKVTNYSYGTIVSIKYFDENSNEIAPPPDPPLIAICGVKTGEYFIEGTKKPKKKK